MIAAKHLLRYLNGTKKFGLVYSAPTDRVNLLWDYVDSDWAGCPDSSKSTSGYALMLNGPVALLSRGSRSASLLLLSRLQKLSS